MLAKNATNLTTRRESKEAHGVTGSQYGSIASCGIGFPAVLYCRQSRDTHLEILTSVESVSFLSLSR